MEILTPEESRGYGSVLGFRAKNFAYDKLGSELRERHGIITRVIPGNGLNSNRISTHIYNSPGEVGKVLGAIRDIITG